MRFLLCLLAGLALGALCLAPAAIAAEQNYLGRPEYASYGAAYRAAERDGKPLLLLVGADWCGPCKQLRDCHPSLAARGHLVHLNVAQHTSLLGSLRIAVKLARIPLLLIWHHGRWEIFSGSAAIRAYAAAPQ